MPELILNSPYFGVADSYSDFSEVAATTLPCRYENRSTGLQVDYGCLVNIFDLKRGRSEVVE